MPRNDDDASGDGLWVPKYGTRSRAADLMGPTGVIEDFIPRPGDSPYVPKEKRGRWGRRILLTDLPNLAPGRSASATIVDTGDMGKDFAVAINIRFGVVDFANPNNQPTVFTAQNPITPGGVLTIKVRRGISTDAPVAVDTYTMVIGTASDIVPFDIFLGRAVAVDISISGLAAIWIEAIASIVDQISPRTAVQGQVTIQQNTRIPVTATPLNWGNILLPARRNRAWWAVTNLSAAQPLILSFDANANFAAAGAEVGIIIVAPGGRTGAAGSRYESPMGGWNGLVTGSWAAADAAGGALITETSFAP